MVFTDRHQFLRKIIELWKERATLDVILASSENITIELQIQTVIDRMFNNENKGDFLFYLRKLCLNNNEYKELLKSIEDMRLDFMSKLLQQLSFSEEKAKIKANVIYHYFLGWYERHKYEPISSEETEYQVQLVFEEIIGG